MNEKRFKEIVSVEKVIDTQIGKEYKCIIDDDLLELLNELNNENEQLKKENQEYKALLQDMGMLMSDEEVMYIRRVIAEKFIKPVCNGNGFDVDVDCTDGFTIIPNNQDLKEWIKEQELEK